MRFRSRTRGRPFRGTATFRGRGKLNIRTSRPELDDYKPSHRARTPSYESSHKIKPHSSLERDYRSRDYKESYSGSRRYDDPRSDRRRYSRSRSRSRSRSPDDSRYRNWRRSRSRNRSRSRHRSFSPHHRSPRRSPSRSPHSSRHTSSFRYQSSQRSPDHFRSGNERLEMQRTLPPGFKESEDPETSGLLEKSLGAGCGVNSPPPESLRITVGNDLFQERCGSKSIHDRLGTPPEATSTQYSGRREKYMDKIGFGEKLPSASVDRSEQEMQTSDKIDMFYNEKKVERNVLLQDTDHFPRAVGPCFNERFKSLLDEREKCKLKLGINVDLKQNSNDSFSTFMKELDSPPWVTSPTSSVDQFKQSSKNSKKKLQELTKDILDTKSLFCGIPGLSDDFPTKSYTGDVLIPGLGDVEGIDDEERFLYGDDADNVPTPKLSEKAHTIDKSIRKKIRKFTRSSSPSSSRSSSRSSSKSSNRSFRNSRSRNSTSRSYSRSPSRKRNRDGLCRDQSEKRGRRDSLRYDDNSYYNKNDADFQSSHGNSFPLFSNLMGNSLKIKDDLRKEKTLHRSTSESNREGNQKIEEVDFLRSFSEPIKGGSRKLEDILKSIGFNFDMLRKPADSTISEHSSSFTTDDVKTENIDKYSKRNDSNMPLCEDSRVPSNVASLIQAARHNSEDPWQQQSSGLVSSQDTLVSNVITSQPSTDYCSTNYSAPHQPPQFPPMAPANYPQFTPYQGHFTPNYSHPMYPGPFPHMPPFPPANDNYDPNVMSTANRSNLRVIPLQSDTQKKIPGPTKLITSNPMSTEKHPPTAKIPTSNLSNLKVVPSSQIENRKKSLNEKPSTVSRNISMEKRVLTAKEKQELALKHEGSLKRLELLEKELDRLKKQQGELMRKKQKQKDGHKDPLLMENNKLQEEISRQINSIRRALEGSGAPVNAIQDLTAVKEERTDSVDSCKSLETEKSIKQNKSIKDEIDAAEKELEYEYFDPGNHWCKQCNEMLPNIYSMFEHLHSKRHIQSLDPYDRPWMPECLKNPKQKSSERTMVAPLKGVQFLMPCSAFYCTICSEFMGDATCAEEHLKKVPHNRNYLRYVLENPFYERRWNLDKAAGMAVRSEEKRKQIVEEDEDRDLKHKKKANETQKKIKENKQRRFKELEGMDSVSDVKENQNDKDNATAFRNKSTEKEKSESPIHPMSEDDTYKSTGFGKFTWRKDEKEFIGPENLEINFETSKDSESDDPNNKVVTKPGSKIAIRLSGKTLIPPSVQFKSVNRKKVEIGKMPQLAFPLRKIKPEKNHSEKPLPLGKFISVEKPSAIGKTVPLPIAQEKSSSPTFLPTQEDIANAFGGKFDGNGSEGATQENLCKVETKLKKEKPESHKMSLDIMTIPLPPADITKNKEIVGENTKSSETSKIKKNKVNSKDSLEVSSDNITNENIQSLSERSNGEMQPNNSDRDVGKDQITEKDDLPNKNISPVIKEVDNTEQLVTENDIGTHKKLQEELSQEENQPQVKKQIELSESEKAAIEDFKMLGIDINDTVVVDVKPPPLLSESLLSNRPINSAATASVCAKDLYEIYFNKNSNANSQLSTEAEIITECVTVIQEKLSGITEDCKKETEKIIQNSNLIMEDDKFKNTIIVSSDNIPDSHQYVSQSENMEVDNQKLENDSVVLLGRSTDTKKSTTTTKKNENISCESSSLLKEFHSDVVPSPNEEMEIDDVTDIEKITLNINSEITTSLQVSEMKESPDVTAQPNLFSAACTKQYPSLSKEKSIDSEKIVNTLENVNLLTAQNTNICSTVDVKNLNSKCQISSGNSIAADEILQSICFTPTALAKNEESSDNKQDCEININKTQIIETQHNLVTEDIIERNSASNNMINQTLNNNPEEKCLPLTDSVDSNFKNSNESKTDEKKVLHSNNESDDVKSPTQTSEREVVQIMADENLANKNVSIMNESDKPTILGIIEKDENVNKTKVTIENDKVESHPFSHVSVDSTKLEASDFHSSYSPSLNKNTDICKNIVPHIESVSLGICKEAVDNISSETEIIASDLVSSENSNNDVDQNKVKDLNLNSKSTVEAVQNSNIEIFQNESESSGILVKENNESCKNDHADLPSLSDICENQATSSEMLVETVLGQTSNETFESMKTDE